MDKDTRIKVYARQRGITQGPMLEYTGVRAEVSYWNVATKITRRQHRRWLKKYRKPGQFPF